MEWWIIYFTLGGIVGYFSGLLGIGGGLVLVPVLSLLFTTQDFPPDRILHLALGTTMATIIFTSLFSLRTHHAHSAVNWDVVITITPGIIIGTLFGATLAGNLTSQFLSILFVVFIFYAATQMLINISSKPCRQLPGKIGMVATGGLIGFVSSLVAIGGGLLSIPFLTYCNVKLHHAIGTASAIGFPIAVAGTLGYIANGTMQTHPLPDYCLGYVYLPALVWLVLASMLSVPVGAKSTHTTQTVTLKMIFVTLLYCLGFNMLYGLY